MAETTNQPSHNKNDEPVFRKRTFLIMSALLTVFLAMFLFYDELKLVCRTLLGDPIYNRIADQDFGTLYDTQVNLIFTEISTLAIITTFMDQRYLGASYKYWLFKNPPYLLTPQENILLMAVNQVGGLLYVLTGGFKMISFLSFLISWYLFLYLCYQMYIYVIKVSYMFRKIKKQLARSDTPNELDKRCVDIYDKAINNQYTDKMNSYWAEEAELILLVMIRYRDHNRYGPSSAEIGDLKSAVTRLIENEAYVRSGLYAYMNVSPTNLKEEQKTTLNRPYREIVNKLVNKGNDLAGNSGRKYTYCDSETPAENLSKALSIWYDAAEARQDDHG